MSEYIDKPSPNGCLARALPGEPMLVLLGRDACAPDAIRRWRDLRARRGVEEEIDQDAQQIADALDTADEMEAWRLAHDGEWRRPQVEALDHLIWSHEHRSWWAPECVGYTNDITRAGRYSKAAADRICKAANWGSEFNEVAIPVPPGMPK